MSYPQLEVNALTEFAVILCHFLSGKKSTSKTEKSANNEWKYSLSIA